MRIKDLILLIKISPVVMNLLIVIELIFALFNVNICSGTYPIFGHSLFFDILLLILAKTFKLCMWNKLLIYNLIFIITLEWFAVNVININPYFYICLILTISTITILISTLLYYKDAYNRTNKRTAF